MNKQLGRYEPCRHCLEIARNVRFKDDSKKKYIDLHDMGDLISLEDIRAAEEAMEQTDNVDGFDRFE